MGSNLFKTITLNNYRYVTLFSEDSKVIRVNQKYIFINSKQPAFFIF